MRTLKILSFLFTLYFYTNAQMVPQCQCPAVESCKRAYQASLVPCVDACQKYTESLGADFQSLRSCLVQRKGQLDNTIACTGSSLTNACARGNPIMVKKRYSESIKITAMSELNKMFNQMGVKTEIESVMATGKRFFGCLMSCTAKKSGNCVQRMGCGLDLPADSVLVQLGKQCAIQSGFDTHGVQALCQCLAGAGIRQLANICPRIRIF